MIEVNLFGGFQHLHRDHGCYSMTDNRVPKNWRWVRNKAVHDGVTIFTDDQMCNDDLVKSVKSKFKVGMIIEPPQINSNVYNQLDRIINNFDFIITYNRELINRYPEKMKYYPFGGSWVFEENIGIYEKSKNICILYSNKTTTNGHKLRSEIANMFPEVDRYGSGAGIPFEYKEEVLAPYRYTIVIENCQIADYFSEKLLDALAVGTIPIYWGPKDIGKYFDEHGILSFDTIEELEQLLPTLTEELYISKLKHVKNNLNLVKTYWCQEDWLYDNIFQELMEDYEMVDYQSSDPRTEVDGYTQDYWLNKFFQSGGDINLYNLNLKNTSVVFDMGTYDGEYYYTLYNKFQPIIHTFEPIEEFTKNLPKVPNLVINAFALGKQNETFKLSLSGNSSSAFTFGNKITCLKKKFIDYVTINNINSIDLIKINIEGGEYELLNAIIDCEWTDKIDMYLIQFHYLSHNPIAQRQKIINKLKQTHEPVFYYPFVWELWKRKDVL